jgi:hypothetical protein
VLCLSSHSLQSNSHRCPVCTCVTSTWRRCHAEKRPLPSVPTRSWCSWPTKGSLGYRNETVQPLENWLRGPVGYTTPAHSDMPGQDNGNTGLNAFLKACHKAKPVVLANMHGQVKALYSLSDSDN